MVATDGPELGTAEMETVSSHGAQYMFFLESSLEYFTVLVCGDLRICETSN
jgi:hypothetical protein